MPDRQWRILACASQGSGSADEARLRALLINFDCTFIEFNHARKREGFVACLRLLRAGNFDLFVLEGTGLAAGLAAILGRLLWHRPYVVSSGDAVGPFLSAMLPMGAPFFKLYERLLYRCSSGFVGWTPYLVGRALTLGARRAITIPGWAPFLPNALALQRGREAVRSRLGIPVDAIVFGIAGSLVWSNRFAYCYGSELVRAALQTDADVYVLIVGDGSGMEHLKQLAGSRLGKTIFLTGRVPREEVSFYLAAMDVGSLPQSVDGVGSFRYTTKLPEYRSAGLLVVCNQIPMAYDIDRGDILRLSGDTPWAGDFIDALAALMKTLRLDDVVARKAGIVAGDEFDQQSQIVRVTAFLKDILTPASISQGTHV